MSTDYGWEGIRQVCATLLGARHVPERLCGGSVYLGHYNKCSTFTFTFYSVKTARYIIEILSLCNRPTILVFRHQRLFRKSDGFTPNTGAPNTRVSIFDQCGYISEMVIDRGIFTMKSHMCAIE